MSYRPVSDFWYLTRAKLKDGRKFYGAYLGGFPERARVLLGAGINDPVLHVCGGMSKHYPYAGGFGPNDRTLDLDPAVEPDFLQDARDAFPISPRALDQFADLNWRAILIDPPYSPEDAAHYAVGASAYPRPLHLIRNAIDALPIGGRVGILHYGPPRYPKNKAKFIACIAIVCGNGNRGRFFSVFAKIPEISQAWESIEVIGTG